MKALTIPEIAQALWEVSSVLILTHRRPDGDTAGSAAALCRGLRSLGKKAFILENPQLTERYRPYHRGLTCPAPIPGALVVSVDVAGREMLCKGAQTLPVDLLLDHHGTNPGFAARGHIDPSAGACGEIIYRVLTAMGLRLDRPTAEALYVAVSTDTGCFRYSNTTAHTHEAAAKLKEEGFSCRTVGDGETVTDQTPLGGAIVPNNAEIILYLGAEKSTELCIVPNVVGDSAAAANRKLTDAGLIMSVSGATGGSSASVRAISQSETPGTEVAAGTVVRVQFSDSSVTD